MTSSKLPDEPDLDHLRSLNPEIRQLTPGTVLRRCYFRGGEHPGSWNALRHYGPLDARFDHLLPDPDGQPCEQDRAVGYFALSYDVCLAEAFQRTRVVDTRYRRPHLAAFVLAEPLTLVDLTGAFATRIGTSALIHSGERSISQAWGRGMYEAWPELHGIAYRSSMGGSQEAFCLNERALERLWPSHPTLNIPLTHDGLVRRLQRFCETYGYALD